MALPALEKRQYFQGFKLIEEVFALIVGRSLELKNILRLIRR